MPRALRRELTLTSSVALVVSNMIGTGIFTTTGFLAGDLGRPSLVLGVWLLGAIVALAGCLSYAELGVNFPRSGGEYVYLREVWGPAWGFLTGWVSFLAGFSAPIAAGALAFSEYLGNFYPSLSVNAGSDTVLGWLHFGKAQWVAMGLIAFFALINILGLAGAAKLQNVLTALKVGALLAFLVLAFTAGHGHWTHFQQTTARSSPHALGAQFAVSLTFVMFAYSGWNAASYVVEEMKTPERTLPRALLAGTALVGVLYLALNVAFIYALPLGSLKGVVRVGAEAARALFGGWAGNLFSGIMAVSLAACVSAMTLVGPRIYYAMAQDGCFPPSAARLHPRWLTPVNAILYQAVASMLMVLTGTFEALIYYIGFVLILFAALAATGVLRMRRRPDWKRLPAVSWCYPAVPVLFIGTSLWMLLLTLALRPRESSLGLLTVLSGGLLYLWKFRKGQSAKPGSPIEG
ncbi:MAG TPA: amino acid permease [Terriglobia bacterium]|nr:amino acid permease [Terriglobia bacterium]